MPGGLLNETPSSSSSAMPELLYCMCKTSQYDELTMIGCDGESCEFNSYFHPQCAGLSEVWL